MRRSRKITLFILALLFLAILATTTYLVQQLIEGYKGPDAKVIVINKDDKLAKEPPTPILHVLTAYSETH